MSFKVYRNESDPFEQFGDDDRFDIIEGGVLKIHRQDGTITYINPASWASIDDSPATSPRKSSPSNHHARTDAVPAGGGPSFFSCAGSPRRVQSLHGRQDNHQGRQHALAARPAGPNVPGDGGRRGDAVVARPASGSAGAGGRTRLRDSGLCDLGTRRAAQRGPDGPSGAGQRVGRSPARPAHLQDPRAVHGG